MKLQLKLNGEWAVLPPNFSLKIMKTSPLFSDQGDFSYPFELPVVPNRHIFGPIADPMGFVRLREFHGLPAEIWFDGNQVFVGQTEISGEQTFSQRGKVSFNVVSNNGAFKDMIDGMNCRDVKPKEKIVIGWRPSGYIRFSNQSAHFVFNYGSTNGMFNTGVRVPYDYKAVDLPNANILMRPFVNVTRPYPFPFCNIRACAQRDAPEENSSGDNDGYGYSILYADRPGSAPCFYVLYFIDCLAKQLGIFIDNSDITKYEDMKRLAMVNAFAQYKDDFGITEDPDYDDLPNSTAGKLKVKMSGSIQCSPTQYQQTKSVKYNETATFDESDVRKIYCVATQKNFPNTDVKKLIDSLRNGFGVCIDYDQQTESGRMFFVKDVMRDTQVVEPHCTILEGGSLERYINNGYCVTYGQSDNDYFTYKMPKPFPNGPDGYDEEKDPDGSIYFDWYEKYEEEHYFDDITQSNIVEKKYIDIVSSSRLSTDTNTYYDKTTGNAYRMKVNKQTGKVSQMFEVGGYGDYVTSIVDDEDDSAENIQLDFTPVVINDVWGFVAEEDYGLDGAKPNDKEKQQLLAVWFDATLPYGGKKTIKIYDRNDENWEEESLTQDDGYKSVYKIKRKTNIEIEVIAPDAYDFTSDDKSPLEDLDIGLQLGVMRGAGNDSKEEIVTDYDDEGNDTWMDVIGNYNFTADCIDNYGRVFDYNGTSEGGASFQGRISLKLDARKVKEYDKDGNPVYFDVANKDVARRGLVPQLLEDFLYFKAHHVKVTLPVLMSLSTINNLQLLKWNRFGDYVGLIKQVNYELTESGLKNVTIELLVANK